MSLIFSQSHLQEAAHDFFSGKVRAVSIGQNSISFEIKEKKFTGKWIKITVNITAYRHGELTVTVNSKNFLVQVGKLFPGKLKKKLRKKIKDYQFESFFYEMPNDRICVRIAAILNPWLRMIGAGKMTNFVIDGKTLKIETG